MPLALAGVACLLARPSGAARAATKGPGVSAAVLGMMVSGASALGAPPGAGLAGQGEPALPWVSHLTIGLGLAAGLAGMLLKAGLLQPRRRRETNTEETDLEPGAAAPRRPPSVMAHGQLGEGRDMPGTSSRQPQLSPIPFMSIDVGTHRGLPVRPLDWDDMHNAPKHPCKPGLGAWKQYLAQLVISGAQRDKEDYSVRQILAREGDGAHDSNAEPPPSPLCSPAGSEDEGDGPEYADWGGSRASRERAREESRRTRQERHSQREARQVARQALSPAQALAEERERRLQAEAAAATARRELEAARDRTGSQRRAARSRESRERAPRNEYPDPGNNLRERLANINCDLEPEREHDDGAADAAGQGARAEESDAEDVEAGYYEQAVEEEEAETSDPQQTAEAEDAEVSDPQQPRLYATAFSGLEEGAFRLERFRGDGRPLSYTTRTRG